jgi:hypothetical protein
MSHWPLAIVNGVLVQLPRACFGPNNTDAVADEGAPPDDAMVELVVVLEVAGWVVDVDPEVEGNVAVVPVEACVPEPLGGGSVKLCPLVLELDALLAPPEFPITMPMSAAAIPTMTKCHVCHDRRSLMRSSPGDGASGVTFVGDGTFPDPVA